MRRICDHLSRSAWRPHFHTGQGTTPRKCVPLWSPAIGIGISRRFCASPGLQLWDHLHGYMLRFGQRAADIFCHLKTTQRKNHQQKQNYEHKNTRMLGERSKRRRGQNHISPWRPLIAAVWPVRLCRSQAAWRAPATTSGFRHARGVGSGRFLGANRGDFAAEAPIAAEVIAYPPMVVDWRRPAAHYGNDGCDKERPVKARWKGPGMRKSAGEPIGSSCSARLSCLHFEKPRLVFRKNSQDWLNVSCFKCGIADNYLKNDAVKYFCRISFLAASDK